MARPVRVSAFDRILIFVSRPLAPCNRGAAGLAKLLLAGQSASSTSDTTQSPRQKSLVGRPMVPPGSALSWRYLTLSRQRPKWWRSQPRHRRGTERQACGSRAEAGVGHPGAQGPSTERRQPTIRTGSGGAMLTRCCRRTQGACSRCMARGRFSGSECHGIPGLRCPDHPVDGDASRFCISPGLSGRSWCRWVLPDAFRGEVREGLCPSLPACAGLDHRCCIALVKADRPVRDATALVRPAKRAPVGALRLLPCLRWLSPGRAGRRCCPRC